MEFLKKYKWVILSLIVVFLFTITFPYTGDDIEWSLTKISPSLLADFAHNVGLNGRYLGNLFVSFMTKSILVRGIIMSIVLVTIVSLIKKETKISSLVIWLLLLLMPLQMFKQSIVWTSGFTNYVISTAFLLVSLLLLKKSFKEDGNIKGGFINLIVIFLSGLFIENLTVFLVLITIVLNIIYYLKNKKVNVSLLFAFIGSIIGAITMFSHPAYYHVVDGSDTYRGYANSIMKLIEVPATNFVNIISYYVAASSVALIGLLTILLAVYNKKNKAELNHKTEKIVMFSLGYMTFYSLYILTCRLNSSWQIFLSYTRYLDALLTGIYLVLLVVTIILLFKNNKKFIDILSVLLVIIGLTAPLFMVNPIGPRNFFMIYTLEVILVCYILKETEIDYMKYSKVIIMSIIIYLIHYASIYTYINYTEIKRNDYILYKSDNTTDTYITVPNIPYHEYVWDMDFIKEHRQNIYKNKYNLRDNITFKFVDLEEWEELLKEEGYNN